MAMDFQAKLKELLKGRSRARLARDSGVPASVLNSYVNRGSKPSAEAAFKIAKTLGISFDWLIDDERGLPIEVRDRPTASALTDRELMDELSKRFRLECTRLRSMIDDAKAVHWRDIYRQLKALKSGTAIPSSLQKIMALALFLRFNAGELRSRFNPKDHADSMHWQMPGREREMEDLDPDNMIREADELLKNNDVQSVYEFAASHLKPIAQPKSKG